MCYGWFTFGLLGTVCRLGVGTGGPSRSLPTVLWSPPVGIGEQESEWREIFECGNLGALHPRELSSTLSLGCSASPKYFSSLPTKTDIFYAINTNRLLEAAWLCAHIPRHEQSMSCTSPGAEGPLQPILCISCSQRALSSHGQPHLS